MFPLGAKLIENRESVHNRKVLCYKRPVQQPILINNALTRSDQEAVLNAVKFKTEVLWAQLDALYYAYVDPGNIPPGAFIPENYKKLDK